MYEGNLNGRDNRWGGGAVWLVQRSNLGFGFVWGFKIKLPVEGAEGQSISCFGHLSIWSTI